MQKSISLKSACILMAFLSVSMLMVGVIATNPYFQSHGVEHDKVNVEIRYEKSWGSGILYYGNAITNIGENETRNRMAVNGTYVNIGWISIGNATVSVSLTKLTTEYIRPTATINTPLGYQSHSAFNLTVTYMFTETVWLNACGCQWDDVADSDNNLYASAYLQTGGAAIEWNNLDNLTITWILSFSYS